MAGRERLAGHYLPGGRAEMATGKVPWDESRIGNNCREIVAAFK